MTLTEFLLVDRETHEPCPTRPNVGGGTILCTITDPTHRHMAAHMIPRLTLTLTGGGGRFDVLAAVEQVSREEWKP